MPTAARGWRRIWLAQIDSGDGSASESGLEGGLEGMGIGMKRIPRHWQWGWVYTFMRRAISGFVLGLVLAAPVVYGQDRAVPLWQGERRQALQPEAEQLLALANESRAVHGAGRLQWDPELAMAARQHCLRMAAEGPISHQYRGEPDVSERAGQAGAHFSLIEENVAIGPDAAAIHEEWMHSPGHRTNLLNPDVDRMGAAVVSSRGVLYAVADYSHAVAELTPAQIEAAVGRLVRARGVSLVNDAESVRGYCAGLHGERGTGTPRFLMRWQDADLTHLPAALEERIASGNYRQAAVASCPAEGVQGTFTAYRVAVGLY